MVVVNKELKTLKEKRIEQNLSYQEMADKLSICKTFYWQIENGQRRLTYIMAKEIAKIFNSMPDELFFKDV